MLACTEKGGFLLLSDLDPGNLLEIVKNRVYDSLSGGSDCSLERILSGSNLE